MKQRVFLCGACPQGECGRSLQQDRGLQGSGGLVFLAFVRTCTKDSVCVSCAHAPFPVSFHSCSTVTARTTPLITGFIKRRVKEDTGGTKRLIEERSIVIKAAPGKRERSTQKKKATRSPKMKGREDTKRKHTKKAFTLMTRGTEVAWTEKRGRGKRSFGKESSRCASCAACPGRPVAEHG